METRLRAYIDEGPWSVDDLLRLLSVNALAAVLCVGSWWFASGRADAFGQLTFVNTAIAALVMTGYANAVWLLRGRRKIGRRAHTLLHALATTPSAGADDDATVDLIELAGTYVAREGLSLFHRGDCPLAQGRDLVAMTRCEQERHGRRPCGVCRP